MSNDAEHDREDGPPDQPQKAEDIKRRKALGQFANYTAPATLAMLLSTRVASVVRCSLIGCQAISLMHCSVKGRGVT